jgi:hypothetical protein
MTELSLHITYVVSRLKRLKLTVAPAGLPPSRLLKTCIIIIIIIS